MKRQALFLTLILFCVSAGIACGSGYGDYYSDDPYYDDPIYEEPVDDPIEDTGDSQDAGNMEEDPQPIVYWYDIYFTNPTCPPEEERTGGIDETIAETILNAQSRVDVASFDFEAEPIVNALIELEKRGLPVRVVTDTDNADLSSINRLRRNGISVVEDKRSGLMHNKFVIIDDRYLWVGAMNLAGRDVYCHNNNIVLFDSPELSVNYTAEMDEMYNDRAFGPTSPDSTPQEQLVINGIELENYFAPEKRLIPIIAAETAKAQEEILFMAFSFTHDDLGEAIIGRAEEGVAVRGVFEKTGSNTEYSYYPIMSNAGISNLQVRTDGNGYLMHHKVIIIDRETTIFGSFNFSDSANTSNDESIIIIHDPEFTSYFVQEFESVWNEANP